VTAEDHTGPLSEVPMLNRLSEHQTTSAEAVNRIPFRLIMRDGLLTWTVAVSSRRFGQPGDPSTRRSRLGSH
jgi:hypothetical protein